MLLDLQSLAPGLLIPAAVDITGTGNMTAPVGLLSGDGFLGAAGDLYGTGDMTAPVGEMAGAGTVGAAQVVSRPTVLSGFFPDVVRKPKPIIGHGNMTAPVGRLAGIGALSTARVDAEDAYVLDLLDLDEWLEAA